MGDTAIYVPDPNSGVIQVFQEVIFDFSSQGTPNIRSSMTEDFDTGNSSSSGGTTKWLL